MAHPPSARSESGFALIEVIVSAAVLAILAMAVLSGIDAASNSSAREKARAVAASLAERDQERMRSLSITELEAVNAAGPQEFEVGGVTYQVESQANWVTDDEGGTPACGNSSDNSEYMHIKTTVTSVIVGRNIDPVVIDSLVAPSVAWSNTHGILGVKVVDRNGAGVANVRVSPSKSSPAFAPAAELTDQDGCALFPQMPIGTYAIELNKPGYVDPDGNTIPVGTQKVGPGSMTFRTMEYDIATRANLRIQTNVIGAASTRVNSKWRNVSATNARRVSLRRLQANPSLSSTLTFDNLYPFRNSPYGFFTGSCAQQSPEDAPSSNANYFASYPGSLQMDPLLTQPQNATPPASGPVSVLQPPLRLRITRNRDNNSFTTSNLLIYARPASSECAEGRVQLTFKPWPGVAPWGTNSPDASNGSANSGWVVQNDATGFDPGLPYGDWTICIHDTRTSNNARYQSIPYENRTPGGRATTRTNASDSWTSTDCRGSA